MSSLANRSHDETRHALRTLILPPRSTRQTTRTLNTPQPPVLSLEEDTSHGPQETLAPIEITRKAVPTYAIAETLDIAQRSPEATHTLATKFFGKQPQEESEEEHEESSEDLDYLGPDMSTRQTLLTATEAQPTPVPVGQSISSFFPLARGILGGDRGLGGEPVGMAGGPPPGAGQPAGGGGGGGGQPGGGGAGGQPAGGGAGRGPPSGGAGGGQPGGPPGGGAGGGQPGGPPVPAGPPLGAPKPKVNPPEPYDGEDKDKAGIFLNNLFIMFRGRPADYPTDESRIVTAISFLTGRARHWGDVLINDAQRINPTTGLETGFGTWQDFRVTFLRLFAPIRAETQANYKLFGLEYETGESLKDFVLEFMRLQGESGITDPKALIPTFTSKLPASVRKIVARSNPPPVSLEDWYGRVLQDNEIYEQELLLLKGRRRNATGSTKDKGKKAITTRATAIPKRRPLTKEELELKRKGLCFVCKQAGHMARQCPDRPKQSVKVRAVEEESADEADDCYDEVRGVKIPRYNTLGSLGVRGGHTPKR